MVRSSEQSPKRVTRDNKRRSDEDNVESSPSHEAVLLPVTRTHAAFVSKLYTMVEDEEIQDLISWSENGQVFRVYNPTVFSKNVLPRYFKHNNWQSFVRQLNMYGFNKVNDMIHSNMRNESQIWEFRHPHFRKGAIQELQNIKRKTVKSHMRSTNSRPGESDESTVIQQQQQQDYAKLEEKLAESNRAFGMLYDEMVTMRSVLVKQQEIMENIITLLSLVQSESSTATSKDGCTEDVEALKQRLRKVRESLSTTGSDPFALARYAAPSVKQPEQSASTAASSDMYRHQALIGEAGHERLPSIESMGLPVATESSRRRTINEHTEEDKRDTIKLRTRSSIMGLGKQSHLLNPEPQEDQVVKRRRRTP